MVLACHRHCSRINRLIVSSTYCSTVEVLAVLFRQGVKGADLRERTLDFITNQVMASKETLFKDPDMELFFLEEMQKVRG